MKLFNFSRNNAPQEDSKKLSDGLSWQTLRSELEVTQALSASDESVVLLFKHSTRCIISKMVLRDLEANAHRLTALGTWFFIDLFALRGVSDHVAQILSVRHESPQLIILRNEKVIWAGSHQSINADQIRDVLSA